MLWIASASRLRRGEANPSGDAELRDSLSGLDRPCPLRARQQLDREAWADELALHDELFRQLEHRLPPELPEVRRRIAGRLAA